MKWIKSGNYRSFAQLLVSSENWSPDQVCDWQLNQVKTIVDYAYAHVPGYRLKFKEAGYLPGDIKSWNDFEKLPFLSKDEIKNNFSDFVSDEKIPSHKAFTSGSTGKPMQFMVDCATSDHEKAMFQYYWSKYGYRYGDKCIVLRGQGIADLSKKCFYQYDRFQNYKQFDSSLVSNPEYLEYYDRGIRHFHAQIMQAYPSAVFSLAKNYAKYGIDAPKFHTIFLGSENVTPYQCGFIKEVFHAEYVMYHYGLSECTGLALKHPEEDKLCFIPVYGYTEIINNGTVCREVGENGEIVTTGLNKSMPFIRYKTGDFTSISETKKDSFLRNCKVVDLIEGRTQDYVVTKNKKLVPVVWICGQHIKTLDKLSDFQYEQTEIGKLIVKVVIQPGFCNEESLISDVQKELSHLLEDVEVTIKKVDAISKNPRGKRISMIQKLDTESFR
jgi:phenylacetate-CoA ligase